MRKIVFFADIGYAGMNEARLEEVDDNITTKELAEMAYAFAVDFAESYDIEPREHQEEEPEDGEEEMTFCGRFEKYSDNIDGWWEEYNPEKHDGII